jgi:hypothetical protein
VLPLLLLPLLLLLLRSLVCSGEHAPIPTTAARTPSCVPWPGASAGPRLRHAAVPPPGEAGWPGEVGGREG